MDLLKDGVAKHAVKSSDLTMRLTIDNHPDIYQVYEIRLDQLYYNDQNDRIATWISQYKTDNGVEHLDMQDLESYNAIIHGFITDSNPDALKKTQKNIALIGQDKPGVVLSDGRVIDGNRRFTCLRNIQKEKGKTQYFKAVILPHDIRNDAKQVKLLELQLQHGVDKPVDYDPIDRLVGIYNDIVDSKMLTVAEYAQSVNQTEAELNKDVELAKLMVEYLEFMDAPKKFHLIRTMNLNGPLNEAYAILKKCKDPDTREDLKNIIFTNFLMQPSGDMTRYIRKIKKIVASPMLLKQYIDEQLKQAEIVCEIIAEKPANTEKAITEIKAKEEITDELKRSTEKWVSKADGESTRNKPAQQIDKAVTALEDIDVNIIKKLNDEQLAAINEKLDTLQEYIDNIRGGLNV